MITCCHMGLLHSDEHFLSTSCVSRIMGGSVLPKMTFYSALKELLREWNSFVWQLSSVRHHVLLQSPWRPLWLTREGLHWLPAFTPPASSLHQPPGVKLCSPSSFAPQAHKNYTNFLAPSRQRLLCILIIEALFLCVLTEDRTGWGGFFPLL